jgi:hypothetical protein
MCFLVGFHDEGARVLRRPEFASWALGWTDLEYRTTKCEECHIGYRRFQHPDRESSDSSAENTTINLPKISQTYQSSASSSGQVGRESDGQR